ncbi:MAG: TetR/AcrR family transcriptional regulator [Flavobacteriales bacterium]|nr:TetR/AcrR family transcriptional regulator [Flavobacteriales bacterium]
MEQDKHIIIDKVKELFFTQGAKSVTMDDVCSVCGMSKKTLYQYFPNKESLIIDILQTVFESILLEIQKIQKENHHPIEELFIVHNRVHSLIRSDNDVFMHQLCKYYPEIHQNHCKQNNKRMLLVLQNNIQKGIEMGLYRSDFDVEIITRFFFVLSYSIKENEVFNQYRLDSKKLHRCLLTYHINAIVSEQGKKDFLEIENKYKLN